MCAMKDSGVEWIGEIPAGWGTCKFKYCAKVDYGFPADSNHFNADGEGIPLIRIRDITSGTIATWYSGTYPAQLVVRPGDMLIGMDGDFGLRTWSGSEALLNQRCCRIRGGMLDDRYLFHCMAYPLAQINDLTVSTTVKHLLADDIASIELPIPSRNEQMLIGEYLDAACSAIDGAIEPLEAQLATLELYRASVIHEAVTRGLDQSAPTKPSGVDWIGNIPQGWETIPLGCLGSFQNGISKDGASFGSGYPFVSYGDAYKNRVLPGRPSGLVKSTSEERHRYSVRYGDVLFTRTSETIEEIAYASTCLETIENATFAGFLIRFRPECERLDPRFGSYYFRSKHLRNYFVREMMIVTRASLGQQLLKRLPVMVPPLAEQQAIADYLDARTAAIDAVIETKRKQLDVLKRRRQSLIYEYVTGKRRVGEEG